MIERLFKNTIILSSSQVISRLLSLSFFLITARYLGTELFGKYTYSFTLILILTIIADLGLTSLTVREISQDKSKTNYYLFNSLLIRLLLSSLIYFFLYFYVTSIANLDPDKKSLFLILGLYLFLRSFFDTSSSFFQAYEMQNINGYLELLNNLGLLIAASLMVFFNRDLILFAFAPIIGMGIASTFGLYLVSKKISFIFEVSTTSLINILKNTFPFGLTLLASVLYVRMDILIISWFRSDIEVGEYGAALRLIDGLLITPIIGGRILYPLLSRFSSNHQDFKLIVEKSLKILSLLAFFFITLGMLSASEIILFLYSGSYFKSIVILQVLLWTLITSYPNYILGFSLFSLHRQKKVLRVVTIALFINICLSVFLVPKIGSMGAAFSVVISNFATFVGYIWFLRDRFEVSLFLIDMIKIFLVSCITFLIGYYYLGSSSVFIRLPISGLIFMSLIFLIGLVKRDDIQRIGSLFIGLVNRD